jgi:AcrR family transcriptional regulator
VTGLGGRSVEADDKREVLLDAAERVFVRAGHAGATMSALAAEAGVTRPTVYAYFPSKEHVFVALADRVRREFLALQEQADTSSHRETLRTALSAYLAVHTRHSAMLTVIAHQALVDPGMRLLHLELHQQADRRHSRFLQRLVDQGLADPPVAPALIAEAVTGIVHAFARQAAEDPQRLDELTTALVDLYARMVDLA